MKIRILSAILVAVCLLSLLGGCANKEKEVVGSCAGYDVLYEELRFVALSERKEGQSAAELERAVVGQIAADYAVLSAAKEFFPDLTLEDPEIQKAVDAAVEEAVAEYGSKSKYKSFLKEHNLTENYARLLLGRAEIELKWKAALEEALFAGTELESETAFAAWLADGNFVRVRKITAESETTAAQIREALLAGKTAEEAVQGRSGVDLSSKFYLVRGYSDDEILEADAFVLTAENPIGELRATAGGYRLLVLEEPDLETFTAYQLPTYLKNMREEKWKTESEKVLAKAAEQNLFRFNDFGSSLDLAALK